MELVSIIMSVFNEEKEWLIACLDSLVNQTYKNIELIIVLDKKENTKLKQILREYEDRYPFIKFLINDSNLGITKSLNKALTHCQGTYIARMDADDISDLNRIQVQKDHLEEIASDVVFSSANLIDEEGVVFQKEKEDPHSPELVEKILHHKNYTWHPSWFMRKEVYESLNGYREVKFCEDYDFLLRALERGYKIARCPGALISYRIRRNSISQKNLLVQMLNANYILKKYKTGKLSTTSAPQINQRFTHVTDRTNQQFMEATRYFNQALDAYWNSGKRDYPAVLTNLIKAIWCSPYIIHRIRELISLIRIEKMGQLS